MLIRDFLACFLACTGSRNARRAASVALPILASALGPVSAQAYTLKESGEWVVSCDNTATCSLVNASQLTQIRVAQPSPFGMSRVCIHRRAGPEAAVRIFVTLRTIAPRNLSAPREPRMVRVVGGGPTQSDIALEYRGAEHWEVPQDAADKLLASWTENGQLQVTSRDGIVIERLPVDGLSQALTTVDKAQGRAGTITALREKGSRQASSVPARRPERALVTAPLPKLTTATQPSPDALRLRQATCGMPALDATEGYRLLGDRIRPDRILWVTSCVSPEGKRRAYFVIQNEDGKAAPVSFPGSQPERPTGQAGLLATPELDAQSGMVLETWRGAVPTAVGNDCAIQRRWGWNGQAFELAEERRSRTCVGVVTGFWPRTFTRALMTPAADAMPVMASSFQPPC